MLPTKYLFGLIGKTLTHSFSKSFFEKKFQELQLQNHSYQLFELPQIENILNVFHTRGLRGLNVTLPYKEAILAYVTEQDEVVKTIGASNCIRFKNGKAKAFNTDVLGFKNSLVPLLRAHHTQALILGNGGAAKAVAYVLQELGIAVQHVTRQGAGIPFQKLSLEIIQQHTLLINTTPLGMYPHVAECPPIPYEALQQQHLVYDLIYNPTETLLLNKAKAQGAAIKNGEEMLVLQAEESWKIWNEEE